MTAKKILQELKVLLPTQLHGQLELNFAIAPSLTICMTVDEIIKKVDCNLKEEKYISYLLEHLLKIHFNTKTPSK